MVSKFLFLVIVVYFLLLYSRKDTCDQELRIVYLLFEFSVECVCRLPYLDLLFLLKLSNFSAPLI